MDAIAYEYGIDLYRRIWPNICCSKYDRLPRPHYSVVRIHRTPSGRIAGNHQHLPFCDPNQRYGSLSLAHHDRNVILDKVCFYNSDNCKIYKENHILALGNFNRWQQCHAILFFYKLFVALLRLKFSRQFFPHPKSNNLLFLLLNFFSKTCVVNFDAVLVSGKEIQFHGVE